jgi:hypothetical protein
MILKCTEFAEYGTSFVVIPVSVVVDVGSLTLKLGVSMVELKISPFPRNSGPPSTA